MRHDVVAWAVFVGFVLAGLVLTRTPGRAEPVRRRRITLFLLYGLGVSCAVGFAQRATLFPFHTWTLFGPPAPDSLSTTRWYAIDSAGMEQAIDYRAWQPISYWELRGWFDRRFPHLTPTQQVSAAEYLLALAERARERVNAGERPGTFDRFLGLAAIPLFHTYDPTWARPGGAPPARFVGLRWYRLTWDRATWMDDGRVWRPDAPARTLVYEYLAP